MQHIQKRQKRMDGFKRGNVKVRDHLVDLGAQTRIIILKSDQINWI